MSLKSLSIIIKREKFPFFDPVATTVEVTASRIGPKWSTSNSNSAIGPICDTIKSIKAATCIKKYPV